MSEGPPGGSEPTPLPAPPVSLEAKERKISHDQAREAYLQGDAAIVAAWARQEQERIDGLDKRTKNQTYAQCFYELKCAQMRFAKGEADEAFAMMEGIRKRALDDAAYWEKSTAEQGHGIDARERQRRFQEMIDFAYASEDLMAEWRGEVSPENG